VRIIDKTLLYHAEFVSDLQNTKDTNEKYERIIQDLREELSSVHKGSASKMPCEIAEVAQEQPQSPSSPKDAYLASVRQELTQLRSSVVELQNTLSHKDIAEHGLREELKRAELKLKGRSEGINVEYLKNVVVKYLNEAEAVRKGWQLNGANHIKEKKLLLQVIATILEFTKDERRTLGL